MRNLQSRQVIARFEGHLYAITSLSFSLGASYSFVSAANSECLFWDPREYLKSTKQQAIEVSQPDKILDLASSDVINHVTLKELSSDKSTAIIAVSTDSTASIFYVKASNGKASGNKVVKKESSIRLHGANEQILNSRISSDSAFSIVHGSIYAIKRSQVKLQDDAGKI